MAGSFRNWRQPNGSSVWAPRLARIFVSSGIVDTAWRPQPNGTVRAILVAGDKAIAGGEFSSIGGQYRNHLAALQTGWGSSGRATSWRAHTNSTVRDLALSPDQSTVYAAGTFTKVAGSYRARLAAVSVGGGTLRSC